MEAYHFGNWINSTDTYNNDYKNNTPFEHCIIDNFLDDSSFTYLKNKWPESDSIAWDKYENPIEMKWTFKNFTSLSEFQRLISFLQSDKALSHLREISGIDNLENDPYLHGAGIHYHPTNTKLDIHLDYSIHPITKKERRLNLVYFLNEDWNEEWNGALELWSKNKDNHDLPGCCEKKIYPKPNRAIIFKTNDISIHGIPEIIRCPETTGRKTVAVYYMSEPHDNNIINRKKAIFFPKPGQPVSDDLLKLYSIRRERRIEREDLYTNWRTDPIGKGYWY